MLRDRLVVFVAKRALMLFILLAVLDVLLIEQRWHVLAGMTVGGIFGFAKFSLTAKAYLILLSPRKRLPDVSGLIMRFIFFQLLNLVLLASSMLAGFQVFCGMAAGILIIPAVISLNSVTEGLGITHNGFR